MENVVNCNRVILHCDLNNFYASVECLEHPEYKNIPLVVAGKVEDRHGIVLAKNIPAKKLGIQTGDVIWQAKQKARNLVVIECHFEKYVEYSRLVREIYKDYTNKIECFGLDECWLDVTNSQNLFGNGEQIANTIRNRVKNELGLTISVGVSWNKIFAKLGSDYKKPDATTVINKNNYKTIVYPLPALELFFVGRRTFEKLKKLNINTIGDLAGFDKQILKHKFGKNGETIYNYANGFDNSPVRDCLEELPIKSVGNSTTTRRDLTSKLDVKHTLFLLADSVGARMRQYGYVGKVVHVSFRKSNLEWTGFQTTIDCFTNANNIIAETAYKLFEEKYLFNTPIRTVGLTVSHLKTINEHENCLQLSLFDSVKINNRKKIDLTIDKIRAKYGFDCIKLASLCLDENLTGTKIKDEFTIHPIAFNKHLEI